MVRSINKSRRLSIYFRGERVRRHSGMSYELRNYWNNPASWDFKAVLTFETANSSPNFWNRTTNYRDRVSWNLETSLKLWNHTMSDSSNLESVISKNFQNSNRKQVRINSKSCLKLFKLCLQVEIWILRELNSLWNCISNARECPQSWETFKLKFWSLILSKRSPTSFQILDIWYFKLSINCYVK